MFTLHFNKPTVEGPDTKSSRFLLEGKSCLQEFFKFLLLYQTRCQYESNNTYQVWQRCVRSDSMTKAERMVKNYVKLPNDLNLSVDFHKNMLSTDCMFRFGDVSLVETTYESVSVSSIF